MLRVEKYRRGRRLEAQGGAHLAIRAYMRQLYDGVPEAPDNAPERRNRAAYLGTMSTHSTWRGRLDAADEPGWEEFARPARACFTLAIRPNADWSTDRAPPLWRMLRHHDS
jgi:hypothetical protein